MTTAETGSSHLQPGGEPPGESSPGEFANGWPVVLAAFVGISTGISSTFFYSTGVFMKPIAAEFGWGRGDVTLGPVVASILTALLAPVVGRLVDRFGTWNVVLPSMMGLVIGLFLLAYATQGFASYLLLMGLLAVLGGGTTPLPFTRALVAAFRARRGLALGLAIAGSGFGAALVPALLSGTVAQQGWRGGYMILAGVVAVGMVAVLAVFVLARLGSRERFAASVAATLAPETPDKQTGLMKDRAFLLLGLIFLLAAFAIMTMIVHFVPMLTDAGMPATQVGLMASAIGVSLIVGRIATGFLLDHVGAERLAVFLFLSVAVAMVLLIFGGSDLALAAAIAAGIGVGAEIDLMAYLAARHFPMARYGAAYGGLYAVFLVGAALGPLATGYIFDTTGDYRLALWICAACLVLASLLFRVMPKPRFTAR